MKKSYVKPQIKHLGEMMNITRGFGTGVQDIGPQNLINQLSDPTCDPNDPQYDIFLCNASP